MVLTDADFGRAYLTEGWARRFLLDIFMDDSLCVLFVGYSGGDPPVQYLARALPPAGIERRFALTPETNVVEWKRLGVVPVAYKTADTDGEPHEQLRLVLGQWADFAQTGSLGHEARVHEVVTGASALDGDEAQSTPPRLVLDPERESYLLDCITDPLRRRFFVQHARGVLWLRWARQHGLLDPLFKPQELDEQAQQLSRWAAAEVAACPHELASLLPPRASSLAAPFWWALAFEAEHNPQPEASGWQALIAVLLCWAPPGDHRGLWARLAVRIDAGRTPGLAVLLVLEALKPVIEAGSTLTSPQFDLVGDGNTAYELARMRERLLPALPSLAPELLPSLEGLVRTVAALGRACGGADHGWDRLSRARPAIEPHPQNRDWSIGACLIDLLRECLDALSRGRPDLVSGIEERWASDSEHQLLTRMAIYRVAEDATRSGEDKIRWLLKHGFLYVYGLKHEVFRLLERSYPQAAAAVRAELLKEIVAGNPRMAGAEPESRASFEYEIYNALVWLRQADPACPLVEAHLSSAQRANPDFVAREFPDLDSWVGSPRVVGDGPSVEDLATMSAEEIADLDLARGAGELADYLSRHMDRSWPLVNALASRQRWKSWGHWGAILSAWGSALDEAGWPRALEYLQEHVGDLKHHLREIADMLAHASEARPARLPGTCIPSALRLAGTVTATSVLIDEQAAVGTEDIAAQSLNHSVGRLFPFWLNLTSVAREGRPGVPLPVEARADIERVLAAEGTASQVAAAALGAQLHYLYALDREWARAVVLPLMDWDRDPRIARGAWHGFLTWGRWTHELLPELRRLYEGACQHLDQLCEEHVRHLGGHFAAIFVFGADPAMGHALATRLAATGSSRACSSFAYSIWDALGGMEEAGKETLWSTRLGDYWRLRQAGAPSPLLIEELKWMLAWLPRLGPVFAAAADRACAAPAVTGVDLAFLFEGLKKGDHPERTPQEVLTVVAHWLRGASKPFWGEEEVFEILKRLRVAGIPAADLRPVCETLTELDANGAAVWLRLNAPD